MLLKGNILSMQELHGKFKKMKNIINKMLIILRGIRKATIIKKKCNPLYTIFNEMLRNEYEINNILAAKIDVLFCNLPATLTRHV